MTMTVQASAGQSLVDICLTYYGDARYLADIALLNDLSVSEPLAAGQRISIDTSVVLNPLHTRAAAEMARTGWRVNTGDTEAGGDWNNDFNNDYQ